jgi:NAD-dependent dihydropyrimidine dehydrogenase PreA subunit
MNKIVVVDENKCGKHGCCMRVCKFDAIKVYKTLDLSSVD